jgi:hypothetical protein
MKREPCLVFHRSDHGRVHANIPPPHRDCNPRGTQRRAGHLAELEEPKEGGSYGDASKKVNGAKMRGLEILVTDFGKIRLKSI